ncbi:hypothetical protein G3578_07865 [Brevibacillus sp. SYP-B805]|jgi:predicted anti-sigma-YlaC factor YlaD|uniref:anti-sigma factor family protein n=1 Tax=Brevibacillus sp. SYP-B805 TaxID=1578199 RepID=UPI0013EDB5E8|nr:zf-HC2 domain-containing protein [Brevibacillus sp. SYP-B805]NGQ95082.1 hypothetical protein [Brevibacillus sp. SYP-B805]
MRHIDELTLMMYVDSELSDEERIAVQQHLPFCSQCQEALRRLEADQTLFAMTFAESDSENLPIRLDRLTEVQIDAIASLHRQNRQQRAFRHARWLAAGVGMFLLYFYMLQNQVMEWLAATWSAWQSDLFWISAFWLRDNAGSFLLSPETNSSEIAFLFAMLLAALVLLNTRNRPAQWSRMEGREKK